MRGSGAKGPAILGMSGNTTPSGQGDRRGDMTVYQSYIPTGTYLYQGDGIASPSNVYWMVLQFGGDNVVYTGSFGTSLDFPVWSTGTPSINYGTFFNIMQADGNFVEWTATTQNNIVETRVWETNTGGATGNYFASLSDSGEFAVYQGIDPSQPGAKLFSNSVNNPVTGINLTNLTYDLDKATFSSPTTIHGELETTLNTTDTPQLTKLNLSLSYTKSHTWSWNLSESLTAGISSTTDVGVPGLASEKIQISVSETTAISKGESSSQSESKTFNAEADLTVPAFSEYGAQITAQHVTFNVPYTFEGIATYQSGITGTVNGSGIFNGGDATIFMITFSCLDTPGGCEYVIVPPPTSAIPAPEPMTLLLLPTALVAAGVLMVLNPASGRRGLLRRIVASPAT